jgi:quinolinate synthase
MAHDALHPADLTPADLTPADWARLEPIHDKLKGKISPLEWQLQAPLISAINKLKLEMNAVVLAHNYMTPEIFHGVGDYVGDSLGLAREAANSKADIIIQGGVHFMAETSKILAPRLLNYGG